MGRAFFPCVLVPLVCLTGGAGHQIRRRGLVQGGLDAPPPSMEWFVRQTSCTRETCHGLALDHPTQQQHKARGALPDLSEDGPGQHGIVTIADPTAVCWKVVLCTEQTPCTVPTARACPPMKVEMTFQPESKMLSSMNSAIGKSIMRP
jgi:hypothetical protein